METTIYDASGRPCVYITDDEDMAIYTWDGRAVAYIDDENVYGWNGRHLGWFCDGIVYDNNGLPIGFTAGRSVDMPRVGPVKQVKHVKRVKRVKHVPSVRPVFGTSPSGADLLQFISQDSH